MMRNKKKNAQMTPEVKRYGYLKIAIPWKMLVNQF